MQAGTLRLILVLFLIGIYLMAVAYLRRRRMSLSAYAFWGLFALVIPALGPFLVIVLRPGISASSTGLGGPSAGASIHRERSA